MSNIERLEREIAELEALPDAYDPFSTMLARLQTETAGIRAMLKPEIRVQPADVVMAPAAEVVVNVPDQTEAIDRLTTMFGELVKALIAKETVVVNVPAPVVTVMQEGREPDKTVTVTRGRNGLIEHMTIKEN